MNTEYVDIVNFSSIWVTKIVLRYWSLKRSGDVVGGFVTLASWEKHYQYNMRESLKYHPRIIHPANTTPLLRGQMKKVYFSVRQK